MSVAATSPQSELPTRRRPLASKVVIILGVAVAVFTALSGVASQVFDQHDDATVTRVVFGGIPSALKLVFYIVIPVLLIYGSVLFRSGCATGSAASPTTGRPRGPTSSAGSATSGPGSTCRRCFGIPPRE